MFQVFGVQSKIKEAQNIYVDTDWFINFRKMTFIIGRWNRAHELHLYLFCIGAMCCKIIVLKRIFEEIVLFYKYTLSKNVSYCTWKCKSFVKSGGLTWVWLLFCIPILLTTRWKVPRLNTCKWHRKTCLIYLSPIIINWPSMELMLSFQLYLSMKLKKIYFSFILRTPAWDYSYIPSLLQNLNKLI